MGIVRPAPGTKKAVVMCSMPELHSHSSKVMLFDVLSPDIMRAAY